jgi:hypothetical protein
MFLGFSTPPQPRTPSIPMFTMCSIGSNWTRGQEKLGQDGGGGAYVGKVGTEGRGIKEGN